MGASAVCSRDRGECGGCELFVELTVIRLELLLRLSLTCAMRRCGPRLLVSAHACGARPPLSARISRAASSLTRENSKRNRRGRGGQGRGFRAQKILPQIADAPHTHRLHALPIKSTASRDALPLDSKNARNHSGLGPVFRDGISTGLIKYRFANHRCM